MILGKEINVQTGEVIEIVATPEEAQAWYARVAARQSETVRDGILAQIDGIESTVTQRRIREAALTDAGKSWLATADSQIAALRAQLA